MSVVRTQRQLFHPRVLRHAMSAWTPPADLQMRHQVVLNVGNTLRSGALNDIPEVGFHADFLEIFRRALGYRTVADGQGQEWDLSAEQGIPGAAGRVDGAIGRFSRVGAPQIVAPIELKGASTSLDRDMSRGYSPVQQAARYAAEIEGCRWFIVSNYREIRLYDKHYTQIYQSWSVESLQSLDTFREFYFLFCREHFIPADGSRPLVDRLLDESRVVQKDITDRLYTEYRDMRAGLFAMLCDEHPEREPNALLRLTQKILDRVLFVAFAEDRSLMPARTIRKAWEHDDPYNPRPRWENVKAIFRWVDKGNPAMGIPAYNGGLFREDPELDSLRVSDRMCEHFARLADYDFADDVSVLVLGHIFEQSISDIEELRRADEPADSQRKPSRRKKDGVFYTPEFVTQYMVAQTLGRVLDQRRQAIFERERATGAASRSRRLTAWRAYLDELPKVRVIDPACGSGAFLLAAFDYLTSEYMAAQEAITELEGGQIPFLTWSATILRNNLFGVDLNEESVEITRLSLWLKSVTPGEPLTALDANVVCGNSVVDDPAVDPRAFRFEGAFALGSFDVVIGNPPYVRQELLRDIKPHLQQRFEAYDGVADLYVYFYELGLRLLATGGLMSYIVTNKWFKAGYGAGLRSLFERASVMEQIIDFGHAPIFHDADTFPCIVVLRRTAGDGEPAGKGAGRSPAPADPVVRVASFPRERLHVTDLTTFVADEGHDLPWSRFRSGNWSLEPTAVDDLMRKIEQVSVPLKEYLGGVTPYYGIKTGLNEAFLIDADTRRKLVTADLKCAEIIKPYLRGQDIKRWFTPSSEQFIIALASSQNKKWTWSSAETEDEAEVLFQATYPSVYAHMKALESRLKARADRGTNWWELRTCQYYELFSTPRVVYQVIQFHPAYTMLTHECYGNDKTYFFPTDEKLVLASLNSPVAWWYNWRTLTHMKDEALNPSTGKIANFPVPQVAADHGDLGRFVDDVIAATARQTTTLSAFLVWLRREYQIDAPGNTLSDPSILTEATFMAEVKKRRPRDAGSIRPTALRELLTEFAHTREEAAGLAAQIARLEMELAQCMYKAYQLTDHEVALLWKTAVPRMPGVVR